MIHRLRPFLLVVFGAIAMIAADGCGQNRTPSEQKSGGFTVDVGQDIAEKTVTRCCPGKAYRARTTAYYPDKTKMEGGFHDRRGKPLHTLQDFLEGKADYVSVAMDKKAFPYGTKVCLPELEEQYSRAIPFRVVDTGGAFKSKGVSRIDICVRDRKSAIKKEVNRQATLVVCDK